MATHILIPIDDSTPAQHALQFACDIHSTSQITVLHVDEATHTNTCGTMPDNSLSDTGEIQRDRVHNIEALLSEAQTTAADQGIEISTELLVGEPSTTIIDYAEKHNIDHIIIGIHGKQDPKQLIVGNVAKNVVRNSDIPATIVQ